MRCLGPMFRVSGVSHSAVRNTTGGDSNPDRCWAFFRPVRVAWSLAAGPAVPALDCFARLLSDSLGRSWYLGAFSNFVDQFPARRRRRNIEFSRQKQKFSPNRD
jgi:hypothetical protein